ncbi:FAD-dependent oxidoreductase [Pseudomonas sp. BF-R-01]|uniref:FAD-dependent oxidoreductase n=1 Tax=Pseudomonas sp. BF-R-01 TaxID=2832365 RepID=UPI00398933E6
MGRVILAGDAAHVINPTGGLGLTSGLFDIYVLHEAPTAVIEGRAEQDILDQYSKERRAASPGQAFPAVTGFKKTCVQLLRQFHFGANSGRNTRAGRQRSTPTKSEWLYSSPSRSIKV